jgi:hypothetical protein
VSGRYSTEHVKAMRLMLMTLERLELKHNVHYSDIFMEWVTRGW